MNTTLNMYSNLQYDAESIQDFTIVEVYTDSIVQDNCLGYMILPIEGLDVTTIETNIAAVGDTYLPSGYEKYVVLPGLKDTHNYSSYNHRVCYLVYYTTDDAPTYPDTPDIGETITPGTAFNKWNSTNISYSGSMPTPVFLKFKVTNTDKLEFYLGDSYFNIPLTAVAADSTSTIEVSANGVFQDDKEILDYDFTEYPIIYSNGTDPSYILLKTDKKTTTEAYWQFNERY